MSRDDAIAIARAGIPVRRAAWRSDPALYGAVIVYVAGAGTTRAVAVRRLNGVDEVLTEEIFGFPEWNADDWERADTWSIYV